MGKKPTALDQLDGVDRLLVDAIREVLWERDAFAATFSDTYNLTGSGEDLAIHAPPPTALILFSGLTATVTASVMGHHYVLSAPGGMVPVPTPGTPVQVHTTTTQAIQVLGVDGRTAQIMVALPLSASAAASSVTVTNFPNPQAVSGSVTASLSAGAVVGLAAGTAAIGTAAISNFPATQDVSGSVTASLAAGSVVGLAAGTAVIGTAAISNFPATQDVSGSVTASLAAGSVVGLAAGTAAIGTAAISNFPATQDVSGSVTASLAAGSVVGLAAGTAAIGTAAISNLPATQNVSGTVSVAPEITRLAAATAGTAIAAGGVILASAFTAPNDGTLNVTYALETATPVQVTLDNGTYYANFANGSAATVNALTAYSLGVHSGAVVQFSVPTATTLGIFDAWYVAKQ